MRNTNKRDKVFGRRLLIIAGLKASLLMGLIARLYYLQILKNNKYQDFSDNNRIKNKLILPLRGKILDRDGVILAGNNYFYRIILEKEYYRNRENLVDKIAQILQLTQKDKQNIFKRIKKNRYKTDIIIKEFLSWSDVAKIEVNAPKLQGIYIEKGYQRYYTSAKSFSHVIGYMGKVSDRDIKSSNPILLHPDFKIGKEGIEKSLENRLRGESGLKKIEVNSRGIAVKEISRAKSQQGEDITLTIDKDLQEFTTKRLEGLSGSVVVSNVKSGEILSFVSSPSFDPDEFTNGVSSKYWNYLINDYDKPLVNKAIANQYPPGSTFKPIVALAGLKFGMDPNEKVYCPGHMDLGRRRFHCWRRWGHGKLNLEEAIMHSCNIYFYHIAKTVGVENIRLMAQKFGLGAKTGIDLKGEKSGLLPFKEWKKRVYKSTWQVGDSLNVGIGQGYMLSTPIQLAQMAARIASGTEVELSITKNTQEPIKTFSNIDVPQQHFDLVRNGMNLVVNHKKGTAHSSQIKDKRFSMAGKTGTAQVISKKALEKIQDGLSGRKLKLTQNHALFIGYAPVIDPKYAISVIIEHGGGGSTTAAPIGRDILTKIQEMEV